MQDGVYYDENLLEQVKNKRRKVYYDEKLSEVIITQCSFVLLILIFVVMNIFIRNQSVDTVKI